MTRYRTDGTVVGQSIHFSVIESLDLTFRLES